MARTRSSRRGGEYGEFWPGYVDVLSTLVLVFIFLLSIFMLAQYFVSQESSGKDNALRRLNRQIAELTSLLSLAKGQSKDAKDQIAALTATLTSLQAENQRLTGVSSGAGAQLEAANAQAAAVKSDLDKQKQVSNEALARVDLLNQQLLALRRQIAALNEALDASEKRDQASQVRIKDLGSRLNAALARQVQELQRYRSDFFGRLRELLKGRKDIRVVGDRFIFQSEVLFTSGQAEMSVDGLVAMDELAKAIVELQKNIPKEIDWSLQVDGHTDRRPISSAQFPSNWHLSTARAISVVRYLISRGVPANRLIAAGQGEFSPLDGGDSEEALRRNRRIELKLTNR